MTVEREVILAGTRAYVDRVALYSLDTAGREAMAQRLADKHEGAVVAAVLAAVEADRLGWPQHVD